MECCDPAASVVDVHEAIADCPSCGARGKSVGEVTLHALLKPDCPRPDGPHRFCRSPACEVVYFAEADGAVMLGDALTVRVGAKETAADRPLCYCFGYTAADVLEDVAATGTSEIPDRITEHCRRGEDRCPETNPQGSCCLGNVRAVMREAQADAELRNAGGYAAGRPR